MAQLNHKDLEEIVRKYLNGEKEEARKLVAKFAENPEYGSDEELQKAYSLLNENNEEEAFRILERASDLRLEHSGESHGIPFSSFRHTKYKKTVGR